MIREPIEMRDVSEISVPARNFTPEYRSPLPGNHHT